MYSERLRELFHSRAHAGKLEDATHYGEAGVPGHGPYIQLWLRVEDEQVTVARFKTYGCPAAIGCAEAVAGWSEGQALTALANVNSSEITHWVGGVPEGKEHCPDLAMQAVRAIRSL